MTHDAKESMELLAKTYDYFPASFRWRGRRFDVIRVERCWTVQRPTLRRIFRVRCHAGSFELDQTIASDSWRVRRAPLALWLPRSQPDTSPRFPLPRRQRRARSGESGLARLAARLAAPRPQLQPAASPTERRQSWTPTPQRS